MRGGRPASEWHSCGFGLLFFFFFFPLRLVIGRGRGNGITGCILLVEHGASVVEEKKVQGFDSMKSVLDQSLRQCKKLCSERQ